MKTHSVSRPMSKYTSIALVVAGAVLAMTGMEGATSSTSAMARYFASWPMNPSIWIAIIGVTAMAFGLRGAWLARSRF